MAQTAGGVLKRGPDRIVAGVCSGLGQYFRIDPLLVRVVFVLLAFVHGIGIVLYLVLWLLMEPAGTTAEGQGRSFGERVRGMGQDIRDAANLPATPEHRRERGMWLGIVLIALGAYLLLDNLGVFNGIHLDRYWPVLLIALGLFLLLFRRS
jgi:phage shock protein C